MKRIVKTNDENNSIKPHFPHDKIHNKIILIQFSAKGNNVIAKTINAIIITAIRVFSFILFLFLLV
jgi:hypothetical protein